MNKVHAVHRVSGIILAAVLALALLIGLSTLVDAREVTDSGESSAWLVGKRGPLPILHSPRTVGTTTFGVELTTPSTSAVAEPGQVASYSLSITNTGSSTDTFDITTSSVWTTTVTPTSVSLAGGAGTTLSATVQVPSDASPSESDTAVVTATSTLDPGTSDSVSLQTLALLPPPCEGCNPVTLETDVPTGTVTIEITATNSISSLVESSGLVTPTIIDGSIMQDATPFEPFDDIGGGHLIYLTDTVPAGALRVVAEILSSAAPDPDLYLGRDDNDNGLPESGEVRCTPFLPGWREKCSIEEPEPGTWWVVVQGYYASGSGTDAIKLAWAVIGESDIDNDALDVSGPTSVPAEQPFDLDLDYDLTGFNPAPGDIYYGGFSLGSEPGSPTDIDAIFPVDLRYLGTPPELTIDPDTISETIPMDGSGSTALTITNSGGDQLLMWEIDESGTAAPGRTSGSIVGDGGFELGSPNPFWSEFGDFAPPICSPDFCGPELARSGDWWAWFGGWATTNTTSISQSVTIPTAQTALLSFYLNLLGNPAQGVGDFDVFMDGNLVASYDGDDVATFGLGYERAVVDISAYADGAAHTLEFVFVEISGSALLDDVAIEVDVPLTCEIPSEVPWLSVDTSSGSTAPDASDQVSITLDAAGLAAGTYSATLCISSNDPQTPVAQVPITLHVPYVLYMPVILYAPN